MEATILEARAEIGWVAVAATCPPEFRARIAAKREAILAGRQNASAAPAAPAVAPQRISDADRNALASRLNNAIKLF